MPATALKHLAKKAKVSIERAEHLWDKSKEIVDGEYGYDKKDSRYWALRMGITKKMLGLGEQVSFSEFLMFEAAVGAKPEYTALSVNNAIDTLNKHAKNSLWMLHENRPLYRGDPAGKVNSLVDKHDFVVVDTSLTTRKSENTSNFYTVILDNHPNRKQFPKRSKSFIATTRWNDANAYAKGRPFVLIPFDDSKIGIVNESDMWETRINLFKGTHDNITYIADANNFFSDIFSSKTFTFEQLVQFDKQLKAGDKEALRKFKYWPDASKTYSKKLLEHILERYSAKNTGHTAATPATFPRTLKNTEVWVGGKVMLMSQEMWDKLKLAYKKK